jgi:hypothetical protein
VYIYHIVFQNTNHTFILLKITVMKNSLHRYSKQNIRLIAQLVISLVVFGFFGSTAFAQIATTTPASRCGEGELVLQATATSGTIKWYDVPFYGTPITAGVTAGGTIFTTPSLAVTKTYYVDAVNGSGCSLNPNSVRVPVTATISSNSIQAAIFYVSNTFCKSVVGAQDVTRTGTAGGQFTVLPSGLSIDANTGAITPSTSAEGTYTITYTVTPAEGCVENPASTEVTITTAPETPSISYTGSPFCTTATAVTVNHDGEDGGVYSASPSGLTINATSGTITPGSSSPGNYTITYFVAGAGGCPQQTATTDITITALPTAAIAYSGAPFCISIATAQTPSLSGTGAYTGGAYSYSGTGALASFNTGTGAFTPSGSNAGTYTIHYIAPASGNCATVQADNVVTINPLPSAEIAGTIAVCQGTAEPNIMFTGSLGAAPYTFTYNVNGGGDQIATTTSGNSVSVAQATVSAGTYAYNLSSVTDANGCSQTASGTATITVTGTPIANFSYTGSPYCNIATATPTFTGGGTAGIFSGTNVVFISTSTGEIDLANTPAGTYEITNTISSCGGIHEHASITINALPTASLSGTTPACATTTLTAATNASDSTFIWYKDGEVIAGQSASTINVTTSGTYKVKVTNGSTGCEYTSSGYPVTINPIPTASITGTLEVCLTTTLTAVSDATAPSYIWYKNGAVIGGSTNVTIVVDSSGLYKVKITKDGCENTSDISTVNIYPATVGGIVAGGTDICPGSTSDSLTLGTYSGSIVRWESSINGTDWTTISNTASTYISDVLTETTLFRAVVQSGVCDEANSVATTVTVNPLPTLTTITGNATACAGETGSIYSVADVADHTYAWTVNGGTFTPTTAHEISVTWGTGASGTVDVTETITATGCFKAATQKSVTINPLPTITTTGAAASVFYSASGQTTTLAYAATSNTPTSYSIDWTTAGIIDQGSTAFAFESEGGSLTGIIVSAATPAGDYSGIMTITNANACLSTQAVTITISKAASSITATGTQSFTYTGSAQGPATSDKTGSTASATYSYSGTGSTTYGPSATRPTNAGTYQVIASVAADDNFNGASSSAYAFEISKAVLTVTAENKIKTYDGDVYSPFTVTYSGFIAGEDETDLGGTLTFVGTAVTATAVGAGYVITPQGYASTNYEISYTNGTLQINPPAPTGDAIQHFCGSGVPD